jgi:hypothetical protein
MITYFSLPQGQLDPFVGELEAPYFLILLQFAPKNHE